MTPNPSKSPDLKKKRKIRKKNFVENNAAHRLGLENHRTETLLNVYKRRFMFEKLIGAVGNY